MRTRVKICCIASIDETRLAIRAGADAVGFVGAIPSSPRALDDCLIGTMTAIVPPPIATFLLTAEVSAAGIARQVAMTGASTVQMVSRLDAGETRQLLALLPATRLVQVIYVDNEGVLDLIEPCAPYVHAFLLDSGQPDLPTPEFGGTGRIHDWSVSAEFARRSPRPVFLAGGLSADNVGAAMKKVRPFGVDLCSGVRTDGHLNLEKLEAFLDAVRRTDAELS